MSQQLGSIIKRLRRRAGISQFDLEVATGAAFGSLSKIELGKVDPTKETLVRIAECLHLNLHEKSLLFSLDMGEYQLQIESINRIHAQPDLHSALQTAANEMLKVLNLHGAAIFLVHGEDLVMKVIGQNWFNKIVLDIIGVDFKRRKYPLNADYSNAILKAARTKKLVVVNTLYECIAPILEKKVCNFIHVLIKIKSLGALPILDMNNNLIGVIPFSFSDNDVIEEKLPIIVAYANTIALVANKYSLQSSLPSSHNN